MHTSNFVKEKETNQLKKEREEAYKEGYTKAKRKWAVHYNCDICNEEILVDTKEEKEAIKRYMREHGWGHVRCQQKPSYFARSTQDLPLGGELNEGSKKALLK